MMRIFSPRNSVSVRPSSRDAPSGEPIPTDDPYLYEYYFRRTVLNVSMTNRDAGGHIASTACVIADTKTATQAGNSLVAVEIHLGWWRHGLQTRERFIILATHSFRSAGA